MMQRADPVAVIFIFFGITDADKETWAQSECLVTSLCSEKQNVQVESSRIERAHRLGAFDLQKCRPIIVKFLRLKIKIAFFHQPTSLKELA
uniref:Putative secreted protein n=1 Tax=Ixodes ricinus TaxID=34613 RepID=A0A090XER5_IXORI